MAGPGRLGAALPRIAGGLSAALVVAACAPTPPGGSTDAATDGSSGAYSMTMLGIDVERDPGPLINGVGQVAGTSVPCAFLWDRIGGRTDVCGSPGSEPSIVALSETGQVLGIHLAPGDAWEGFLWSSAGGWQPLPAPTGRGAALNARGDVAGTVLRDLSDEDPDAGTEHGYVWAADGGGADLGESAHPSMINSRGEVVGTAMTHDGGSRAFRWEAGSGLTTLRSEGSGSSVAAGINDRGQVIATIRVDDPDPHAVLWDDQGVVDLGTLPGQESSAPTDINSSGQVVGGSGSPDGSSRAFLWQAGSGMVALDTGSRATTWAADINDAGQVVLNAQDADGSPHAYLWDPAAGSIDLGALAGRPSYATGVSDAGVVAGWVSGAPSECPDDDCLVHAVIWSPS